MKDILGTMKDSSVDCGLGNSIASLVHVYGCDQDIIVTVGQCPCSQEIHPEVFRVKCTQGALNGAEEKIHVYEYG